jgi:rhodanese-related sulfurtransferase
MAIFAELLRKARSEIVEINGAQAEAAIAVGAVVVDVRETDEYEQGALVGAVHIARGVLETTIESRVSVLVVYCAGECARRWRRRHWASWGTATYCH